LGRVACFAVVASGCGVLSWFDFILSAPADV